MKKIIISSLAIASLMSINSCRTDFDTDVSEVSVTNGNADFTTYVALGNSLTSGYRDNALFLDAQLESYPSIIAQQMKKAGGGEFTQPLMPDNIGGFAGLPGFTNGKLTLNLINNSLVPTSIEAKVPLATIQGTFNNMGVPGAKSFHLITSGYGNLEALKIGKANPYFVRFASSPTTSVLKDAMAKKPTFFSLWIGNNDVLSYATSGGIGVNQTGNLKAETYGINDITDPKVLAGSIKGILDGMKGVGATKGVIANIPDVTTIPFFTTIPYNAIPLTEKQANELNKNLLVKLKTLLNAFGITDRISLAKVGQNLILIKDETLKDLSAQITSVLKSKGTPAMEAELFGKIYGQVRHTTSEDYILLTTKSILNTPSSISPKMLYGITYPLHDEHALTKNEVSQIQIATNAYNTQIRALADTYDLAFVDANAKMKELNGNSGIKYNAVTYTTAFVNGGAFSLDGVHLTGKGYAIIANEFIRAINEKYKATLLQVNPNKYSGINFPK